MSVYDQEPQATTPAGPVAGACFRCGGITASQATRNGCHLLEQDCINHLKRVIGTLAVNPEAAAVKAERDQLRVQLAGCSTAAAGWSQKDPAKPGDYGWSQAYQDVLDLRARFDAAERKTKQEPAAPPAPQPEVHIFRCSECGSLYVFNEDHLPDLRKDTPCCIPAKYEHVPELCPCYRKDPTQ